MRGYYGHKAQIGEWVILVFVLRDLASEEKVRKAV